MTLTYSEVELPTDGGIAEGLLTGMPLFRDRRGFPRWSFIDSRTLPRPRHAKDNTVIEPPPSQVAEAPAPVQPVTPPANAPVVKIHAALDEFLSRDSTGSSFAGPPEPTAAVSWESPADEVAAEDAAMAVESPESGDSPEVPEPADAEPSAESADSADSDDLHAAESADSADSPDSADLEDTLEIPAVTDGELAYWLAERRAWLADAGDWPTDASDESVQLAATRPDRPYVAPAFAGLPADSPAEVRARHGRGFSTHRRRRRKRHHHEATTRRADIDLTALEAALDATEEHVGDGLVDLVVWHTLTGLPLAARGADPVTATLWHQAARDLKAALPHADLPELGAYQLVGLADRRLAVLVHAGPDVGACVTVDLGAVSVTELMAGAIPQLHESLAAASREY